MSEIIANLPFKDYCDRPGVNGSLLKIVHKKSLKDVKACLDGKVKEESDVLDFGKCFHSLALEDREDFVPIPKTYTNDKGEEKPWNWNANVCKKWGEEQGEKITLTEKEVCAVRDMAGAIREELGSALKGRTELSLFAEMKATDGTKYPVKCRIDLLPDGDGEAIIDPKSCVCAEPARFVRSAVDLGYFIQAAFTIDVLKLCGVTRKQFDFLAVESEYPHATCRIRLKDDSLRLLRVGRRWYRAAFEKLIAARKTGNWPGYGSHDAEDFMPPSLKDDLERTA